jgi:1-deoxy-D-xylulose-5-phosphate synthase
MLLDRIHSPADLRELSLAQLDDLAAEIREFVVDAVERSKGGGHLGSNLGAVELTIAVHRVFESPRDIVLWDTGHQAYVHKLLTGRREQFGTLRSEGGLSGYPSRSESPHDWVENSHASTIISYAYGLATAMDRNRITDRRIVAVVGDGALTGGMAYEGLNNLGHAGSDAIIILNDNGRSYAPTVSRLGESLARIRLDPRYLRNKARFEKLLREVPLVGDRLERGFEATLAGVREYFEPPAFFEDLGIRYTGPFDGHDIEGLERALRDADQFEGPIVVHVLTQKGRGYAPAENDPIKNMHDTSPTAKPGSFTAAFTEALIKEAEERPEVVAITAAMPDSTGLLPFAERFPDRCIDVGIAEQHAVTAAAGMAMGGLRPVVAVYSTFMSRAFDQVNLDVGLHGQPVVFCLDRAGITGDDGPSHHGVLDMVLFTKVPNMTVLAPSSYEEIGVMLHDALDITDGPVMIRWAKTPAPSVPSDQVGSGLRGRKVRDGDDVCILSVGKMLETSLEAADALAVDGVHATVWDVRCVMPLDPEMIADAARHPAVVTIEDGYKAGGAGSLMASAIRDACDDRRVPRIEILGVPVEYIDHAKVEAIMARLGLDADGVVAAVQRVTAAASRLV